MLVTPLLDFVVLVVVALVVYVGFRLVPFRRRFDWYASRLGLDRSVSLAAWAVGVVGIYAVGQVVTADAGPGWVLSLGVYVLGLFYATIGVSNRPRGTAISAAVGDGDDGGDAPAVVDGTVRPTEGTLTTPYADRAAVCFHAVVFQNRGSGQSLVDWRTGRTGFAVEQRRDDVVVDPADGRLILDGGETLATPLGRATDDPDAELAFEAGDRPPEAVARTLSDAGIDADEPLEHDTLIRAYTLEPGDEAVVVGEAAGDGRERVVRTPAGRRSVVTTGPLDTTGARFGRVRRHMRLGGGLCVVGLGGALVLGLL